MSAQTYAVPLSNGRSLVLVREPGERAAYALAVRSAAGMYGQLGGDARETLEALLAVRHLSEIVSRRGLPGI